jgi:hypothetical protein
VLAIRFFDRQEGNPGSWRPVSDRTLMPMPPEFGFSYRQCRLIVCCDAAYLIATWPNSYIDRFWHKWKQFHDSSLYAHAWLQPIDL